MRDPSFLSKHGIKVNVPIGSFTALRTGGNADFYAEPTSERELVKILRSADENSLQVRVLGGGTNTVISDHGARGLTVRIVPHSHELVKGALRAEAGASMSTIVHTAASEGYGGLESFAGLPGTVGAAVARNAVVGGRAVGELVEDVKLYSNGKVVTVSGEEMHFGAYTSRVMASGEVILAVTFRVERGEVDDIRRRMLQTTSQRLRRQPGGQSSIMVFQGEEAASEALSLVGVAGERIGDAVVSSKDPNYILNAGQATARDVHELAGRMKHRVTIRLNRHLTENVVWQGEW